MIDESADLASEVAGQVIVFQQDAVFLDLVPTLDLALGLGMIGGSTDMLHRVVFLHHVVFEPVRKVAADGTVPSQWPSGASSQSEDPGRSPRLISSHLL